MPKDNQEIEDIAEELDQIALSRVTSINGTLVQMWDRNVLSAYVQQKLTTYGNARELEGIEEVLHAPQEGEVLSRVLDKFKSELK